MRHIIRVIPTFVFLAGVLLTPVHAGPLHQGAGLKAAAARLRNHVQVPQNLAGRQIAPTRSELVPLTDDLRAQLLLTGERLRRQGERLDLAGSPLRARHQLFAESFSLQSKRLLALLSALQASESPDLQQQAELEELLGQFSARRPTQIHGFLPYRSLSIAPGLPQAQPALTPAYQTIAVAPLPEDLQPSSLAPRSPAIVAHLQAIAAATGRRNWDPVDIYEWVKNNIRTEWYRGAMKGAEETLLQRSGNDADQASLLIALLRAAGYPARYVIGSVQLHPDMLALKQLTGIDDSSRLGDFLAAAGIPHQPVSNGAQAVNYQIEHVWVEACVPYANYRGLMGDEQGRLWIALDTSFKVAGFNETEARDLYAEADHPLSGWRDAYLADNQLLMPLDALRNTLNLYLDERFPQLEYSALLHRRQQRPEALKLLPAVPAFYEAVVTYEGTELPEAFMHQVRLLADDGQGGAPSFDLKLPLHRLSNRQVQISYMPESVADQETINLWGGLDNTPAYLIRLRPVLLLDGEELAVGTYGLAPGQFLRLQIECQWPAGSTAVENQLLVGYPTLLAIVAQEVVFPEADTRTNDAADLLQQVAFDYIDRWNRDEQELAELLDLQLARPLPTIVTVGGQFAVELLLGQPQSISWNGVYFDADLRSVSAIPRGPVTDDRQRTFMQLAALQGSALEHQVLEDAFSVESISTAKLLGLAAAQGVPLLIIDAQNSAELLPTLVADPAVIADVSAAVAAGLTVRIPQYPLVLHAWSGSGWIKEDPLTGEAGYMLSGSLAGGSTAMGRKFWPYAILDWLLRPYTAKVNNDPEAAHKLVSITPWEIRLATAGEELDGSLMVGVKDTTGAPVSGAPVVFNVSRGGGSLLDDSFVPASFVQQLTAISGSDGIARARFIPGESVFLNPVGFALPGQQNANIAGENLIEVQLASGSLAALETPVAILGFAGLPDPLTSQLQGDGLAGQVQSFAGTAGVLLRDRFSNPVANYSVKLTAQPAVPQVAATCDPANQPAAMRLAELISPEDACLKQLPVRGECGSARSSLSVTSRSDGSALAGVVLGGLSGASYPLDVSFLAVGETTHNAALALRATGGACRSDGEPQALLVLNYPRLQDSEGRNVDARPIGNKAQLTVKSYLLHEQTELLLKGETLSCSPDPAKTCDRVLATGTFSLKAPDQVTGNGAALPRVTHLTGSQAAPFLYGLDLMVNEGLNQVALTATASHSATSIANSCDGCGIPATALRDVGPVAKVAEFWGVAIDLPESLAVPVDSKGRLTRPFDIPFTIRPADYVANLAQVLIYADGSLWETLLAPTSGSGTVSLPQGYTFHPMKSFQVQVLLGQMGEVNAITSRKTPVIPMLSNIDLQIDALPDLFESNIGAFVLLNNDYDEQEADPSVTQPDAATSGMLASDDELKRAWLQIDDPDMLGGTWQVRASDSSRLRIFAALGDTFTELRPDDPPRLIGSAPLSVALYLEGLAESPGLHADSLTLTYVSAQGAVLSDTVAVTVVSLDLAVDGNRDREIDFLRGYDERALFWVNNDRDVSAYSSADEQQVEDDQETGDDSRDNRISCLRDLEDLARVQVEFGAALDPSLLSYSFRMLSEDAQTSPMINIFPAAGPSDGYVGLDDDTRAKQPGDQLALPLLAAVGQEPVALPASDLVRSGVTTLLFEGRSNGRGTLQLTASYKGVPVLQRGVKLSLFDMPYFYDHLIVEESADAQVPVRPVVNPEGTADNASRRSLYRPTTDEYVLFVHGWNMQPWEKRRWAETVFKRLWWQGYQGKVGLFDWPCRTLPSWDLPLNYDRSEYLAWHSAEALGSVLETLHSDHAGQIRVLAHSQGNIVVGGALRRSESNALHTYVASQAALSASFYEQDNAKINPVIAPFTIKTPEVYSAYPGEVSRLPYLAMAGSKVGSLISYFNVEDFALTGDNLLSPRWEVNNRSKPDGLLRYGYQGELTDFPPTLPEIGFFQWRSQSVGGEPQDYRYQLAFPRDDFEIYAFGAQSRTRALGTVNTLPVFLPASADISLRGSRDLSLDGYSRSPYAHSRQFRSNSVDEQFYWRSLFKDFALSVIDGR